MSDRYRDLTDRMDVDGQPTPCTDCGAMVPVNLRSVHDEWHDRVDTLEARFSWGLRA